MSQNVQRSLSFIEHFIEIAHAKYRIATIVFFLIYHHLFGLADDIRLYIYIFIVVKSIMLLIEFHLNEFIKMRR